MNSLRTGALTVSEQDHALWNLITDMPKVNIIVAWVSLVLNVFLPGTGSVVVGCIGDKS
jgi:hypothetical protein